MRRRASHSLLDGPWPLVVQVGSVAAAFVIMLVSPWGPACPSGLRSSLATVAVWFLVVVIGAVALLRTITWLNRVERGLHGHVVAVTGRIGIVVVGLASFGLFLFAILMTLVDIAGGITCS